MNQTQDTVFKNCKTISTVDVKEYDRLFDFLDFILKIGSFCILIAFAAIRLQVKFILIVRDKGILYLFLGFDLTYFLDIKFRMINLFDTIGSGRLYNDYMSLIPSLEAICGQTFSEPK